jgi:hypothetical protein
MVESKVSISTDQFIQELKGYKNRVVDHHVIKVFSNTTILLMRALAATMIVSLTFLSDYTEPSDSPRILESIASITLVCISRPPSFSMFSNDCALIPPGVCSAIKSSKRFA